MKSQVTATITFALVIELYLYTHPSAQAKETVIYSVGPLTCNILAPFLHSVILRSMFLNAD